MKAAVWYGHKDIRVMDKPIPEVTQDDVRVKVAWAGICGTDRHEYVGPVFIPVTKPHRLTGKTAPLIIGHEFTGIVDAVGENVTGWKVGDRVTASGNLVCGKCRWCLEGRINICEKLGFNGISKDGAFAEYVTVNKDRLFKVPDSVSLEDAVLTEPLACGVHSTKLIGDVSGKKVVVIGPGMIGISCILAAKAAGADKILAIGVGNSKKELLTKIGVTYIDLKEEDPIEYTRKWSAGSMADIVYECVGIEATLDTALNVSRNGAKIMVMGVFEKAPRFNMNLFQEGERILLSSQAYNEEFPEVLEYMEKGIIPSQDLITAKITLDNIVEDGFEELLRNPDKHIKIAIKIADLD